MEVNKEYMKMCQAATEIQELKMVEQDYLLTEGDLFINDTTQNYINVAVYEGYYGTPCLWLPRQEDLQALLHPEFINYKFPYWAMLEQLQQTPEALHCSTLEEMWLTFLMKRKFNKTWVDGIWTTKLFIQK